MRDSFQRNCAPTDASDESFLSLPYSSVIRYLYINISDMHCIARVGQNILSLSDNVKSFKNILMNLTVT